MKIIRKIPKKEMKKKHPHLMSALNSPDANYCMHCDGLRIFKKQRCVACGRRK